MKRQLRRRSAQSGEIIRKVCQKLGADCAREQQRPELKMKDDNLWLQVESGVQKKCIQWAEYYSDVGGIVV